MPSLAAIAFARSISKPLGLMTLLPRSVPTWKPTAGGLRPTTSLPGCRVGADLWAAEAAGMAKSAAAASSGKRRFTDVLLWVESGEKTRLYRTPSGV